MMSITMVMVMMRHSISDLNERFIQTVPRLQGRDIEEEYALVFPHFMTLMIHFLYDFNARIYRARTQIATNDKTDRKSVV